MPQKVFLDTDLAWAAGFVDGEGCISVVRRSDQPGCYSLRVHVGQINNKPLKKLQKMFGGSLFQRGKVYQQHNVNHKLDVWTITANEALAFLENIYPFLVLKKSQAAVAIRFQKQKAARGKRRIPSERKFDHACYEKLRELKVAHG